MSSLGRGAQNSKSLFEGCPGALGKLASKGMFRALLGSSWPGCHKHAPEELEAVNYEHSWVERPGWKLQIVSILGQKQSDLF